MRKLRFVCAQPATLYYAWQVEVLINNFMEMGVNPNDIDIICWKQNNVIPDQWSKLANHYAARFFFYDETRITRHYISSIRPNLLKQHWAKHPYLKDDAIFYHDCDIIFTKPPHQWITSEMINDEEWYGSDTRWYIAHSYIKSKSYGVIDKMCSMTGLPEQLIEDNELNSIGAQYLMKNVTYEYWDNVERDSEKLFKEITEYNAEIIPIEEKKWEEKKLKWEEENTTPFQEAKYNPLQIWCADMWAVLWGAWRLGYKTNCHENFIFSWGTSGEDEYDKYNIMHNAGVVTDKEGLFYKAAYMHKLPYGEQLEIKEKTASRKYWDCITKIGQKSCLI